MIRQTIITFLLFSIFGIIFVDEQDAFAENYTESIAQKNQQVKDTSLYQWLSHPLLVTGAGATISFILIPMLTRKWQDRKAAIDIKNNMVQKISESVTNLIENMSFRFIVIDIAKKETAFREWRSKTAIIGASVRTYFSGEGIIKSWNRVYYSTTNFYLLFEGLDKEDATSQFEKLKANLEKDLVKIDWNFIKSECVNKDKIDFSNTQLRNAWGDIYGVINYHKYSLIRKILESKVHGLSDNIPDEKDDRSPT